MKNANVLIALVVGLVLGLVVGRMTMSPEDRREEARPGTADTSPEARAAAASEHDLFKADIGDGWVKGSDDPLVTIVEFSNFQCGFCARVQPTIDQLLSNYGDKLRLVFKHMPMGAPAHLAAQAAEAAGAQGKFWEYRSKLYENPRRLARPDLERYAEEVGLDMQRFRADLDNETHKEKVDGHVAAGRALGVRGTPSFFINGRLVRGAQQAEAFEKVIDEEIERARKVLAAGVQRTDLYPTLIADGQGAVTAERRPEAREDPRQPPERRPPPRAQFGKPDITNAHGHGPDDALVTIVEYSNIQCGFCARVRPTLAQIKQEYGDKVRFFYKHQVRPGPAHLVAQAGEAAGEQGKFFEFMDRAFDNRRQIDRDTLESHAQELGLDMRRFRAALDQEKFSERVDAQRTEGMRLGARGTPSFFINGRLIAGAQPLERFKELIDEEIEKANRLLRAGTPRHELYARILEKNEKELGAHQAARPPVPEVRPALEDRLRRPPRIDRADVRPARKEADERTEIDLSGALLKGAPDAPVTIVEFSSYACGFCGRVQPTIERLLREYEGKVRLAFMHRPIGDRGQLAAEATMAAGEQGKFWEYHQKLFANMRALERPDLERYAEELGLDVSRFRAALDEGRFRGAVGQHNQIAMRAGARGTPTFFINGRQLVGAQPIDAFKEIIDEELGN